MSQTTKCPKYKNIPSYKSSQDTSAQQQKVPIPRNPIFETLQAKKRPMQFNVPNTNTHMLQSIPRY